MENFVLYMQKRDWHKKAKTAMAENRSQEKNYGKTILLLPKENL